MAEDSDISWTKHTFNPWWGCTKIAGVDGEPSACDNCYAETFARRVGYSEVPTSSQFPIWGARERRRFFGDKYWNKPLKWNRLAAKAGRLDNVFCGSMCDWAEGRPDQTEHLERLWRLQAVTESLIWLMLSKRPQLIKKLAPGGIHPRRWFGTTAETQKAFNLRWSHLRVTESPVYWLSMEPLFERVKLADDFLALGQRAWVIVGGESGHHARHLETEDASYMRDQCFEAGVPFHFKQGSQDWGKGFNDFGSQCIPPSLRVRQMPGERG